MEPMLTLLQELHFLASADRTNAAEEGKASAVFNNMSISCPQVAPRSPLA
jgi:hypothetical protein